MAFAAYNYSGSRVTAWKYAGYAGGSAYLYFDAPNTGSFYLFAACKGGETNTCTGGGTIEKQ